MSVGGGWEVEACRSRVSERAPQGTVCISPRGRWGSQGQNGESLEDGAERGEGGMNREHSMHTSLE